MLGFSWVDLILFLHLSDHKDSKLYYVKLKILIDSVNCHLHAKLIRY